MKENQEWKILKVIILIYQEIEVEVKIKMII